MASFAFCGCGLRVLQLETWLNRTNLTLVAERCLILGALVLGLLALLGLLVELYCLINPKGIDQLTFLEFTLDVVEYGFGIC